MEERDIYILGIESSCDETAASIVKNGREMLSNVISSQIALHTLFGGVVPEIASRKHIENIDGVISKALEDAEMTFDDIDAIAVTYGPGLVGALLVGVSEAKALAYALNKPLVGVNHIEGHICANYIHDKNFEPPYVALVASGGHSHLLYVKDYGEYEILGRTRDDAAGEAYDKVARAIGMGYPGGPKIDAAAKHGNADAIEFPKVFLEDDSYDFSFSGLKSAVLNYLNKQRMMNEPINENDVAASFQKSVVEVLTAKTIRAAKEKNVKKVAMAGGVSSNSALRLKMKELCNDNGFSLNVPAPILCTDNAAMIASAGFYDFIKGQRDGLDLNANPNLKLGER
ncbi:MAG: tRNA (adenosine(37)-N6)-threonylcarbamoyltransferase complex transferase subunit TsaD [Clostridia bacterium]|jgi:N6-L-threonylcarbamoyladenine synthase|nr:tRNA (adenosine(37)-N6)-threonylcarbamoyltransferase complex transferase subunit TsaD [Clostridia bacterium]